MIHIRPDPAKFPHGQFIGPVRMKTGQLISEEFHEHFAARIGDRTYDRNTGPEDMLLPDYQALFAWAEDLVFEPVN